jgi:glutamine synthetase adenylyltransferase
VSLPLPREVSSPAANVAVDAFRAAGGDATDGDVRAVVGLLGEHAPSLLALALGDPTLPADVLRLGLARRARVEALLRELTESTSTLGDGPELRRALRRFRHRHVVRIALQEILRLADVDATSAEMSALAAAAARSRSRSATARCSPRGRAQGADGHPRRRCGR